MKQQKGITLIALVITIIVLLILAGVTIAMLSGNNSAPQKATEAAQKDAIASAKDEIQERLLKYYDTTYVNKAATGAATTTANVIPTINKAVDDAIEAVEKRNSELEKDPSKRENATITLKTKSFTSTGTIDQDTGAISWVNSWDKTTNP